MADKYPQVPSGWRRPMAAVRSQLGRGPAGPEQPQSQPQPRAGPFSNSAIQDSGSTTRQMQSHQLYTVQPHPELQYRSPVRKQTHTQSYQATGSSSINNARQDDNHNNLLPLFLESIKHFNTQQQFFNESLLKIDKSIQALTSSVSSIGDVTDGISKKLEGHHEILGKLEECSLNNAGIKVLASEMKGFKKTLGKSCDGDDGRTVLGRLDAVTFAVGELLERARDPEANLPGPSSTTTVPYVIDLTEPSPPPVRPHTYVDVGNSPVQSISPLPLKEKSFASVEVSTSPLSSSTSFGPFLQYPMTSTPNSRRSPSGHSFVNDTTTSPDTGPTALIRDNLESASPVPMDVDAADPTESMIESQISSTISINNFDDDVSRTQTSSQPPDHTSTTTTKAPFIETIRPVVHPSTASDLATAKDVQTSQQIAGLDELMNKDDRPVDSYKASLFDSYPGISTFIQRHRIASASASTTSTVGASIAPVPFTQTEEQRTADKNIADLSAYVGVASASEGKQQQKEQSKKGLPKQLDLSTSARDEETPSLDSNVGADGKNYNEKQGLGREEEIKRIEKRGFELDGNHNSDISFSAPGRIDLSQLLRSRQSSSRFVSPSTSLSRARSGSRPSVGPSDDVPHPSRLTSDTKLYSPTKAKVLAGAGTSRSPRLVAAPFTATPSTVSVPPKTSVATPTKKVASVILSHSALRSNTEPVAAPTIRPVTPVPSSAVPPTRRITPAVSESFPSKLASTPVSPISNKPRPLSQTSTLPAATFTVPSRAISSSKNATPATSSRSDQAASSAAMFNEPLPPSQTSTSATQDEVVVSSMVIDNESDEDECENLVEKTAGRIERPASDKFEKEEVGEKQADRPPSYPSPSFSPSPLPPSIPGSPHVRPVNVSGPSTPRPRPALSFALLPSSPLASLATSTNRAQNDKTPEPNRGETLVKEMTGTIELKTASHKFEKEGKGEKQGDRPPSSSPSLSPSPLPPSISGSPHLPPANISRPSTPPPRSAPSFAPLPSSPLASVATSMNRAQNGKTPEPNSVLVFSLSPLSSVTCSPHRTLSQSQSMGRSSALLFPVPTPTPVPESPSLSPALFATGVSPSNSPPAMNLDNNQPEHQSPLFSSPSTANNISVEQRNVEGEGETLKVISKDDSSGTTNLGITTPSTLPKVAASGSTHIPTQTQASIERLLSRDLSPISNVEKGKRTFEEAEKARAKQSYVSLGDDADIVRAKKRKVSEGSKPSASTVEKGKEKAKQEDMDDLEMDVKPAKRSLLNLKAGKKGDSVAITRVKKRKARPDVVDDGETNGGGQHDDGLDKEKPLKRARQRMSDRQMKVEPVKKDKELPRESSFGTGSSSRVMKPRTPASVKIGPPSKGKLSAKREIEVEWPTTTKGDKSEDLVGCDKCTAWYHYGCVGLSVGDRRLRDGKKFFCPPCEAGTSIKKLNMDTECWRPGCTIPSGFVVEKIIGRFKKFVGGQGLQFRYLLQWKGYDLSESSWEPEESMFDPPFMIEKFRLDALEEGIDIDTEKSGLVLLRVAKNPSVPKPR